MTTRYNLVYAILPMERIAEFGADLTKLSEYRDIANKEFKKDTDEQALASAERFIKRNRNEFGKDFKIIPIILVQWKKVVKKWEIELTNHAQETLEVNYIMKKEGRFN